MPSRATERINFGKIKEIIAPPNLIELQTNSYAEFLQLEVAPSKRKNVGLQAVFKEVFPIESYDGKVVLELSAQDEPVLGRHLHEAQVRMVAILADKLCVQPKACAAR